MLKCSIVCGGLHLEHRHEQQITHPRRLDNQAVRNNHSPFTGTLRKQTLSKKNFKTGFQDGKKDTDLCLLVENEAPSSF